MHFLRLFHDSGSLIKCFDDDGMTMIIQNKTSVITNMDSLLHGIAKARYKLGTRES